MSITKFFEKYWPQIFWMCVGAVIAGLYGIAVNGGIRVPQCF